MRTTAKPTLQRPIFLQIIAVCFLLAPIGNILISFYGTGRDDWSHPSVLLIWLKTIPAFDWMWLTLTFVTGILLLIQHKTSWMIAIFNLLLILAINIYRGYTTGELIDVDYSYFKTQVAFSVMGTIAGLCVVFYFRYPYLDRRAGWFHYALPRFNVETPIKLMGQDVYLGKSVNLSLSGVLVDLERPLGPSGNMKYIDVIFPEVKNLKVEAQIIKYTGTQVRLKFRGLRGETRKSLQDWLEDQI
jgi:hypothetical protein